MTQPLTDGQIRAIVAAASAALGVDLYTEETPTMRVHMRFHDLIMTCLDELPTDDQRLRIAIDYTDAGPAVTIKANPAALAAIEARYPQATWAAIVQQFDEETQAG